MLIGVSWCKRAGPTWDNGYIADSVSRFPDRFVGHGLIDPQAADNPDLVRYWVNERNLAGFRFHPLYYRDEKILLTDQNRAMWEEIDALDAVIQFHLNPAYADQVEGIARQYPNLILILDHMGAPKISSGMLGFEPILSLAQYENVYVKISDIAGRSSEDFPFEDVHPFIKALLNAFGAERAVWGTGYPGHQRAKNNWLSLSEELRLIREGLPFMTEADRDLILGGTAANIWRLS